LRTFKISFNIESGRTWSISYIISIIPADIKLKLASFSLCWNLSNVTIWRFKEGACLIGDKLIIDVSSSLIELDYKVYQYCNEALTQNNPLLLLSK
jgi:hypothetical protein